MKFRVRSTAVALIEERWVVEAKDAQEAVAIVLGQNDDGELEFVEDSIIGEESERQVRDEDVVPE
jgi:hypothetical protein